MKQGWFTINSSIKMIESKWIPYAYCGPISRDYTSIIELIQFLRSR
jgi:hypothetical protein